MSIATAIDRHGKPIPEGRDDIFGESHLRAISFRMEGEGGLCQVRVARFFLPHVADVHPCRFSVYIYICIPCKMDAHQTFWLFAIERCSIADAISCLSYR